MNKVQSIGELIYAALTCGLVILFTLMVLNGWSSSDYDLCQQREAWEATGHDYVGIPAGSEDCHD